MRINIALNPQSIKKAVQQLKSVKKSIPTMVAEFLTECCKWIIDRANELLADVDIGANVIDDIQSNWTYTVTENSAKIVNSSGRAAFVEFGVGVVGQNSPHPWSDAAGYDYNIPTQYKTQNGEWHFFRNADNLDLPQGSYDTDWVTGKYEDRARMHIWSRGATGSMYLYNAFMDLQTTGAMKQIWDKVLARYL
jgi:hypothetical protein